MESEHPVLLDARVEISKASPENDFRIVHDGEQIEHASEPSRSPGQTSDLMMTWLEKEFKNDLVALLRKLEDFISRGESVETKRRVSNGQSHRRDKLRHVALAREESGALSDFHRKFDSPTRSATCDKLVAMKRDESGALNEMHDSPKYLPSCVTRSNLDASSNQTTPRSFYTDLPGSASEVWQQPRCHHEELMEFRASLEKEESTRTRVLRYHPLQGVWHFLEDPDSSYPAMFYSHIMQSIVVFSVFITLLQTVPSPPLHGRDAAIVESSIDLLFCSEFLLRFICCPNKKFFLFHLFELCDLMAALVFIPRAAIGFNLDRAEDGFWKTFLLCFVPLIRMTKTLRRFQKLHLVIRAFQLAIEALPVLLWTMVVAVLFFSTAIYVCEPRDNIPHLPKAMWLTIVTMTTVGYGDVAPVSVSGTLVTSAVIVAGVLYLAMPLGIIGEMFGQVWKDRDRILLMQQTRKRLMEWGYTAIDIPIIFSLFDEDGTGEIELPEFRTMVREMGIGLKEQRVIELFASLDVDGGGGICDREFVKEIFPNWFHKLYYVDTDPEKNLRTDGSEKRSLFARVEDCRNIRRLSVAAKESFASRISSHISRTTRSPQPKVYVTECSEVSGIPGVIAPPPEVAAPQKPPVEPSQELFVESSPGSEVQMPPGSAWS